MCVWITEYAGQRPYHASKHMAHSVRSRTLENMTEMTILVCIAVQAAVVQQRATNAASMKAQWTRAAPVRHTHRPHRLCATPAWNGH